MDRQLQDESRQQHQVGRGAVPGPEPAAAPAYRGGRCGIGAVGGGCGDCCHSSLLAGEPGSGQAPGRGGVSSTARTQRGTAQPPDLTCWFEADSLLLIPADVMGFPLAASANRVFMTVPTRVLNWLSSGTAGSGAAVVASTCWKVFTWSVWNAGSEYPLCTVGIDPYVLFSAICSASLVMNFTNFSAASLCLVLANTARLIPATMLLMCLPPDGTGSSKGIGATP